MAQKARVTEIEGKQVRYLVFTNEYLKGHGCYEAKEEGTNRWKAYAPPTDLSRETAAKLADLLANPYETTP